MTATTGSSSLPLTGGAPGTRRRAWPSVATTSTGRGQLVDGAAVEEPAVVGQAHVGQQVAVAGRLVARAPGSGRRRSAGRSRRCCRRRTRWPRGRPGRRHGRARRRAGRGRGRRAPRMRIPTGASRRGRSATGRAPRRAGRCRRPGSAAAGRDGASAAAKKPRRTPVVSVDPTGELQLERAGHADAVLVHREALVGVGRGERPVGHQVVLVGGVHEPPPSAAR